MTAALIIPANISILPLPAKCPELNPVENIWQFMRDGNPPILTGCIRRTYAAIFNFLAGVMPPMPMLGRSLLQVHNQCVA